MSCIIPSKLSQSVWSEFTQGKIWIILQKSCNLFASQNLGLGNQLQGVSEVLTSIDVKGLFRHSLIQVQILFAAGADTSLKVQNSGSIRQNLLRDDISDRLLSWIISDRLLSWIISDRLLSWIISATRCMIPPILCPLLVHPPALWVSVQLCKTVLKSNLVLFFNLKFFITAH